MNLLAPTFLFRFAVPCREASELSLAAAAELDESHRIPSFSELEGRKAFADLRMAWHEDGLLVRVHVTGKTQPAWCKSTRIDDSDGLQLWLDTRDTHDLHRATRFCHRIALLPFGAGRGQREPKAGLVAINRARESPRPMEDSAIEAASVAEANGYRLWARITGSALTGYDGGEHRKLGFFFAVMDRELGWQTLSLGPELPVAEDPSLWGTLDLVEGAPRKRSRRR
ncbi:MAG: hypothetical protein U0939_20265 [Pirellulales bacterium]